MLHHIRHVTFAHKSNGYRPWLYTSVGLVVVTVFLVVLFLAGYIAPQFAKNNIEYFAAVLPGALAEGTNNVRLGQGLAVVQYDTTLAAAAQKKADDMAAKSYFAHESPDGKTPWYWLDQMQYPYVYAGENLAIHFNESSDVVRAWTASPLHYANLVKPEYTHMGIGIAQGSYDGRQTVFVVQLFATPLPAAQPVAAASEPLAALVPEAEVPAPKPEPVGEIPPLKQTSVPKPQPAVQPESVERPEVAVPPAPVSVVAAQAAVELPSIALPPQQPTVRGVTYQPTWFDVFAAYADHYAFAALWTSLFLLFALYLAHIQIYKMHIPHVARGTAWLSVVTVVAICMLTYTHSRVMVPGNSLAASVSHILR